MQATDKHAPCQKYKVHAIKALAGQVGCRRDRTAPKHGSLLQYGAAATTLAPRPPATQTRTQLASNSCAAALAQASS